MKTYYQKRAKEYEHIYQKPERQNDLSQLKKILAQQFPSQNIIEMACGTGYWTSVIAKSARSIHATDINTAVLEVAQQKDYAKAKVSFQAIDMTSLPIPDKAFDGLFGGFIWSHVLKEDLVDFLTHCYQQLKPGSTLIFIDNKYVEDSSTPISRSDQNGNTYQSRTLVSGETFEVIKNFPNRMELEAVIKPRAIDFEWTELDYYWMAKWKMVL